MTAEGEATINAAIRRSLAAIGVLVFVAGISYWFLKSARHEGPPTPAGTGPLDAEPQRVRVASEQRAIPFKDVATESGLVAITINGASGEKLLPETLVGGVGVIDADSDGRPDLVLATGTAWTGAAFESAPTPGVSSVRLFLNRTEPGAASSMRFEEAPPCGLDTGIYAMGVAVGDIDGDARDDLFVSGVGANRLFQNATVAGGPVRFIDATQTAGVDPKGAHARWGTSCGFLDADRDGDLDLLVANYVRWSPEIDRQVDFKLAGVGRAYGPPNGFEGDDLLYFRNRGDGSFEDRTSEAGFRRVSSLGKPIGKALGLVFVDPDGDGDFDVVVANDTVANALFVNDGHGQFEERGAASGLAYDRNGAARGAMGIDAGYLRTASDARVDDLAIAIGNFANEPDALYVSRGKSFVFTDDAIVEGLAAPTRSVLTFGLVLEDFDSDGDLDLAQANGHIEDEIGRVHPSQTHAQRGQVFANTQGGPPCLIELTGDAIGDMAVPRIGRALASADFDLDGDIDLVMTQAGGPVALLRNGVRNGHWVGFLLRGRPPNTSAIGARIEVEAGGRIQRRLVSPTRSYLSQCERIARVGLGASTTVDQVTVVWPDGSRQSIAPPTVIDRVIDIVQSR